MTKKKKATGAKPEEILNKLNLLTNKLLEKAINALEDEEPLDKDFFAVYLLTIDKAKEVVKVNTKADFSKSFFEETEEELNLIDEKKNLLKFVMVALLEKGIFHFILPVLFGSILFILAMFFNVKALPYVIGFFALEIILVMVIKRQGGNNGRSSAYRKSYNIEQQSDENRGEIEWQE